MPRSVLLLLALLATPCCAEDLGDSGAQGACSDQAGGECTADETPLLQVQRQAARSSPGSNATRPRGTLSAKVFPMPSPGDAFPGPRAVAKTVACFSGGGTRALSVAVGAWRALNQLGLADKFEGVASVSGGSWANSQYMFAKTLKGSTKPLSNEDLLGAATWPSKLNMRFLKVKSSTIGASGTISTDKLLTAYLAKKNIECAIVAGLNGNVTDCKIKAANTAWVDVYGQAMLGQYGLDGNDYMAASTDAVRAIVERNPSLRLATWTTPREDRPKSYVIIGVLGAPVGYIAGKDNLVAFQMSPDYTGSPYYPNGSTVNYLRALGTQGLPLPNLDVTVGGGLVETFAFGGEAPSHYQNGNGGKPTDVPAPKAPFRLSDAIGISSQAEATAFSKVRSLQNFDPTHLYWPVTKSKGETQEAQMYTFGDGGNLDNLAVIPMLQNKAEKLAVFFAASSGITTDVDLCNVSRGYDLTHATSFDMSSLFGWMDEASNTAVFQYRYNQVFPKEDFQPLLCNLQTLKNQGKPAISRQALTVVRNDWWGIPGGNKVEVLWYHLETVAEFEDKLPKGTKRHIDKNMSGSFPGYPFYQTILLNPPEFTAYKTKQINLLAAQVEYSVRANAQLYKDFLR